LQDVAKFTVKIKPVDRFSVRCVLLLILTFVAALGADAQQHHRQPSLSGKVINKDNEGIEFAVVRLAGTDYGCTTDEKGMYRLFAPTGDYTLVVSYTGYETVEKHVKLTSERQKMNIILEDSKIQLNEVVVMATGVEMVKKSAFNTVAIDTRDMQNSTKSLSDALAKAPGMKLRESGGVGSDMQVMMDGFSGKHVKVFIDGVPQEGVGSSFSINNIPVNFADRIEIYKGVVPVGFGSDAIGGVVNIVTNKHRHKWFADASYSFGSFNTHKSSVNFGQTLANGFTYEINAFQNYSDNNYRVNSPVEDFVTGRIDRDKKESVKRFNDTYHNEAVVARLGVVNKPWADRLMFGFTYSHMYKEVQTGVRQEIVYGEKHRHGYSLMPSVEYAKRDLFTRGLSLTLTANYNRDLTTNVDTASVKYNWRGETAALNSPGEQSYLHSRANNNNWNGTATLNYRIGEAHRFTFNHVINAFNRRNTSLLTEEPDTDPIAKQTRKNISGLSYRYMHGSRWNASVFGKYYDLFVAGPISETSTQDNYVRHTRHINTFGYGAAATYFVLPTLQAKLSYEKACRLPTIEELFGDEDLEVGEMSIKPEKSHNVNFTLGYNQSFGSHSLFVEAGVIYRKTSDYIQRNIFGMSGGKYAATYINYGEVLTKGLNISARYAYSKWFSIGANFTSMNVADNMPTAVGSAMSNINYKERIANIPYLFADSDVNFYVNGLGRKGNKLTLTYDNQYTHSFTYYSSNLGANKNDYVVPNQFAHNVSLSYSVARGRYNFSVECHNFTDAKLYDNFSLQKAGRAIYGKVRVHFGN
jgi:outer membrane cobalamin receptor